MNLQDLGRQVWADSACDRGMRLLVDLRHATVLLQPAQVGELTGWLLDQPQSQRGRAVLVVAKPVETALCLMIQSGLRGHCEVAVFSSIEAAQTFLDPSSVKGVELAVTARA